MMAVLASVFWTYALMTPPLKSAGENEEERVFRREERISREIVLKTYDELHSMIDRLDVHDVILRGQEKTPGILDLYKEKLGILDAVAQM